MKVEIVKSEMNKLTFLDLKIGDVFEYEDSIFIKTGSVTGQSLLNYNSYCIYSCPYDELETYKEYHMYHIDTYEIIKPRDAKVIIYKPE